MSLTRGGQEGALLCLNRRLECWLTDVAQVDQAVLADVGAGAGLWPDDGAAALLVADDAELGRLDTTRQVHIEHGAQLLQQLNTDTHADEYTYGGRTSMLAGYDSGVDACYPKYLLTISMLK